MSIILTGGMSGHRRSFFLSHAVPAIQFERAGDFHSAAKKWETAVRFARKDVNREWASERAAFCTHAHLNGWGKSHASEGV